MERKLRRILSNNNHEDADASVDYVYSTLKHLTKTSSGGDAASIPELLVLTAEYAINNLDESLEIVNEILDCFFKQSSSSKNQFYIRALLLKARAEANNESYGTVGKPAVVKALRAIHYVTTALDAIKSKEEYKFLVYNTSVVYYNIIRKNLQMSSYFIPSLTRLTDALLENQGTDFDNPEWTITFLLLLSHAYDSAAAGGQSNASKRITQAYNLVSESTDPSLTKDILLFHVHLATKYKDCQSLAAVAKKELSAAEFAIQSFKSSSENTNTTKGLEAVLESDNVLSPDDIADIGLTAAMFCKTSESFVKTCVDRVKEKRGSCSNTKLDLLIALCPRASDASSKVEKIVEAVEKIKTLERLLAVATRALDFNLIVTIAITAWNTSLILLQPHLRSHTHRLFTAIVTTLKDFEFNTDGILSLRAMCHLEAAKCDIQADFLQKALYHINASLSIDYDHCVEKDVTALTSSKDNSIRALDKAQLLPLQLKLNLKTSLYDEPSTCFEKAMMLVEQAKDSSSSRASKASLLARALGELSPLNSEESSEIEVIKLYMEIANVAWSVREGGVTSAALNFIRDKDEAEGDKVLRRIVASACYVQGETLFEKLVNDDRKELQQELVSTVCYGIEIGNSLKESYLVENGMIYLWNFFITSNKITRHNDLILPALRTGLDALKNVESQDFELQGNLVVVLCTSNPDDADALISDALSHSNQISMKTLKKLVLLKADILLNKSSKVVPLKILEDRPVVDVLAYVAFLKLNSDDSALTAAVELYKSVHEDPTTDDLDLDLVLEIWSLLARVAIDQQSNNNVAIDCCTLASKAAASSASTKSSWETVIETLWGRALANKVNVANQDRDTILKLTTEALSHFEKACTANASPQVVLEAAKRAFNSVVTIRKEDREFLLKPLLSIYAAMRNEDDNAQFQKNMLVLIASMTRDEGTVEKALGFIEDFVKLKNSESNDETLLKYRVIFKSKLGKSISSSSTDSTPIVQSKMWRTVASWSSNLQDTYKAFSKSIAVLLSNEEEIEEEAAIETENERISSLLSFATWQYNNNFATADVQNIILLALDSLNQMPQDSLNVLERTLRCYVMLSMVSVEEREHYTLMACDIVAQILSQAIYDPHSMILSQESSSSSTPALVFENKDLSVTYLMSLISNLESLEMHHLAIQVMHLVAIVNNEYLLLMQLRLIQAYGILRNTELVGQYKLQVKDNLLSYTNPSLCLQAADSLLSINGFGYMKCIKQLLLRGEAHDASYSWYLKSRVAIAQGDDVAKAVEYSVKSLENSGSDDDNHHIDTQSWIKYTTHLISILDSSTARDTVIKTAWSTIQTHSRKRIVSFTSECVEEEDLNVSILAKVALFKSAKTNIISEHEFQQTLEICSNKFLVAKRNVLMTYAKSLLTQIEENDEWRVKEIDYEAVVDVLKQAVYAGYDIIKQNAYVPSQNFLHLSVAAYAEIKISLGKVYQRIHEEKTIACCTTDKSTTSSKSVVDEWLLKTKKVKESDFEQVTALANAIMCYSDALQLLGSSKCDEWLKATLGTLTNDVDLINSCTKFSTTKHYGLAQQVLNLDDDNNARRAEHLLAYQHANAVEYLKNLFISHSENKTQSAFYLKHLAERSTVLKNESVETNESVAKDHSVLSLTLSPNRFSLNVLLMNSESSSSTLRVIDLNRSKRIALEELLKRTRTLQQSNSSSLRNNSTLYRESYDLIDSKVPDELEDKLHKVLDDMKEILGSELLELVKTLQDDESSYLLLLVDPVLGDLPFEAFFQHPRIVRDFSYNIHCHRKRSASVASGSSGVVIADPRCEEPAIVSTLEKDCHIPKSFSVSSNSYTNVAELSQMLSTSNCVLYVAPGSLGRQFKSLTSAGIRTTSDCCKAFLMIDHFENESSLRNKEKVLSLSLVEVSGLLTLATDGQMSTTLGFMFESSVESSMAALKAFSHELFEKKSDVLSTRSTTYSDKFKFRVRHNAVIYGLGEWKQSNTT